MNLQPVVDWSGSHLPVIAASSAVVVEIILRLIPSEKPKSILLAIRALTGQLCQLLLNINAFLDKIIPQNIK